MNLIIGIVIISIGVLVGVFFLGIFLHKQKLTTSFENAQLESKKILDEARREADRLVKTALKEGKEEARRRRKTFEEESKKRKGEISKLERKIRQREETLENKITTQETKEQVLADKEKFLESEERRKIKLIAESEYTIERNQRTLQKIANMSADEAKKELMTSLEETARKEGQKIIKQVEDETRKEAANKSREIISVAVQRLASDYVNDSTVTVVSLPSDEMKGRIIGREGRNIRAIEQATGVDLIIDDTPEAVIISCFNPIRREIAKLSLEKLIADGRIHPARIEETVSRVQTEFNSTVKEYGEQAAFDVGVSDLHPELLSLLGKLKFRNCGLQSILQHCMETAQICGLMATELGINTKLAKRVGLLHDIGKAVDHDVEGHHAEIGAKLCKKFNENDDIVEAVSLHHADSMTNVSALAVILAAANTLSANRPSARRELLSNYVKRLSDMEQLIKDFDGVEKAYILQSGREVRVMVTPDDVTDEDVMALSNEIAYKIRQELTYPGQVRVSVLRESKVSELAQ